LPGDCQLPKKSVADPEISVVVPVLNEAPNLEELCRRITAAFDAIGRAYEIVVVDDGSTDGSIDVLQKIREHEPRLRIVRLMRNFGQTPALYAAFSHVRGRIVVTLDADLQNPPEEARKLLDKLDEGYDVVQGWRESRRDNLFRKGASRILNALISRLIGGKVKDLGCGFKAYRREVIDRMVEFTHHARYLPAEIMWLGVKLGEVKVEHRERAGGDSKYSLWKLLRLNFDMISSISSAPIKVIGVMGWLLSLVGFGLGARIFAMRIMYGNYNPLATVTAVFFVLAGVQLIATGLMCEYVGRIFVEVQNKPYYVIKDVIE